MSGAGLKTPARPPRARARAVLALGCLLALVACGGEGDGAPVATGRYRLDQQHYARRLVAERLAAIRGKGEDPVLPSAEQRRRIQQTCIAQAKAVSVFLDLRADGAFLAKYEGAGTQQRLAGSWEQAGAVVTFTTTQAPGGRVRSVPIVRATRTMQGLFFGGDVSGWAVPHEFLLRRVE